MIPKIIHYCWFGNNEKPDLILRCIQSWHQYCPDYEIIEWNESNWDVNQYAYAKNAYEQKKWAFVSDVARLDVVYRFGGFYLDTDVELKESLDRWREYSAVFAFETAICIANGLICGSVKNTPVLKRNLEAYDAISPPPHTHTQFVVNTEVSRGAFTDCFPELKYNGKFQVVQNVAFLSSEQFESFAHHFGTRLWLDENLRILCYSHHHKPSKIKSALRNPKRLAWLEAHLPKKLYKLYIFLVYDFWEMGFKYFFTVIRNKFNRRR